MKCLKIKLKALSLIFFVADLPVDCDELFNKGEANSGIYVIKPNQTEPFNVYCEMGPGE